MSKKFQIQYMRNGVWINGKTHDSRKDALEQAVGVWKDQAFEAYQILEVK